MLFRYPALIILLCLPTLAWAEELAPNQWKLLKPQPCEGELCSQDYPEFRGYSGSSIGDGRIWWWGGGHKAGPTNDIDVYDISENRWNQLTTAEDIRNTREWDHLTLEQQEKQLDTWDGGRGAMYWSPLGRFMTHHSYSWQLWHPVREKYCGLWPYPPQQYPVLACYDPAKGNEAGEPAASGTDPTQPDGAFRIISRNVPDWKTARHAVGLTWDSKRKQIVMVNASGRDGIWRYDATTDAWNLLSDSLLKPVEPGTFAEGYIDYHPGIDAYFANKRKQMNLVDAESGQSRRIANPPTGLRTFSLEYSPEVGRMLLAGTGRNGIAEIHAYDAETDRWDKLQLGGQVPTESTLGYDLFDRSPETGQYYLLRRANKWNRKPGVYTVRITEAALNDELQTCPVDACVGDAFEFASIQSAVDTVAAGATVGLAERDYMQCVVIDKPIILRSLSGRAHIRDRVCNGKAVIFVNHPQGTVHLEGIEVSGGRDVKGIWQHNDTDTLILRDVTVHDSGMGVFAGVNAESLQIYGSEIHDIHDRNELAHFIYAAESSELIVEGSHLHGGTDGHLIKAQAIDVTIRNNRIIQERPTDINLIDVWGCGTNIITGNKIGQTNDHMHAIGFTSRRGGKTPCPVERNTGTVTDNIYHKDGGRKWTGFVTNLYQPMTMDDFVIENNTVTNAWLYRGHGRKIAVGQLNGINTQ